MEICLQNVTKQYFYGKKVLACVDLTFESGQIVSLLGSEGSGKTSLLKVVAGVEEIQVGRILFDEKEMKPKDADVQMVFDDLAIFNNKSVFDNIAYPLKIRRENKKVIKQKVFEIAQTLEMESLLDEKISDLTELDKKYIALARILLRDAKVLLIDDICQNLCEKDRNQFWGDASKILQNSGKTIIFATDSAMEAVSIADKIVVLHDGRVKQFDTAYNIWNNPKNIWASQATDQNFSFADAVLLEKNDNLVLQIENDEILLDKKTIDLISEDYIGKNILFGGHIDAFCINKIGVKCEVLQSVGLVSGGYRLELNNGLKVWSEQKRNGTVFVQPNADKILLFDKKSENCILK